MIRDVLKIILYMVMGICALVYALSFLDVSVTVPPKSGPIVINVGRGCSCE